MKLGPGHPRWELAVELTQALNERDMERIIELSDPGLEFRSLVATAEGEVFVGLDGLREWQARVESVIDDFRIEILEAHEGAGGQVVVVYRLTGTGRTSGAPLEQRIGQVWTWRGGRPWRNDVFGDPADAMRAAGLDP